MIRKEQHFLETPHPTNNKLRRRKIQNYIHFKEEDPATGWETTDPGAEVATGKPDGWGGGFTFTYYFRKGALQCALGVDPQGRPHIRMRIAARRSIWVEYVWLGGGTATVSRVNRRIRFDGFKPSTRFVYIMGKHRINSQLRLKDAGHPAFFRYQLKIAPSMSWELIGQQIFLRDDQGVDVMRLSAPIGKDSSTVAPTPDGTQSIAVTLSQDSNVGGHPTFRWTPEPADLASAVYPVILE